VNLDYNIARYNTLRRLPGWQELVRRRSNRNRQYVSLAEGTNLYVTLQEQQFPDSGNPRAWKPVRVSANPPRTLAANQVALKGVYEDGSITMGYNHIPSQKTKDSKLIIIFFRHSKLNKDANNRF
jgi:uncharacterized membrane-anchored protein